MSEPLTEQQLDELGDMFMNESHADSNRELAALAASSYRQLRADNAKLREALAKHGKHKGYGKDFSIGKACALILQQSNIEHGGWVEHNTGALCDCGLDAELRDSAGVGSDSGSPCESQPERPHPTAVSAPIRGIYYPPDVSELHADIRQLRNDFKEVVAVTWPRSTRDYIDLLFAELMTRYGIEPAAEPAGPPPDLIDAAWAVCTATMAARDKAIARLVVEVEAAAAAEPAGDRYAGTIMDYDPTTKVATIAEPGTLEGRK